MLFVMPIHRFTRTLLVLGVILALPACKMSNPFGQSSRGVKITPGADTVRVEINGELFTEYHFKNVPRPYFYPLIGPDELPMTRNYPMTAGEGEEHDHPHHRSLWYAHGAVNGLDFWSEEKKFGKIVHDGFTVIESGAKSGVIKSQDRWVAADGTEVCTDDRTMRIYNYPGGRLFDFEITLHATDGPVTLGDTKEGSMAMRLAETMRLHGPKGVPGQGHIINSAGVRDDETWGKRADWCDYYGPVNGKIVGVAIFDNPNNPRHPTSWHVRDYGLFAANPFGLHDFEKAPKGTGDLTIPAGQSVTFRYRFYLHEGDEKQANVAGMYREYVNSDAGKNK